MARKLPKLMATVAVLSHVGLAYQLGKLPTNNSVIDIVVASKSGFNMTLLECKAHYPSMSNHYAPPVGRRWDNEEEEGGEYEEEEECIPVPLTQPQRPDPPQYERHRRWVPIPDLDSPIVVTDSEGGNKLSIDSGSELVGVPEEFRLETAFYNVSYPMVVKGTVEERVPDDFSRYPGDGSPPVNATPIIAVQFVPFPRVTLAGETKKASLHLVPVYKTSKAPPMTAATTMIIRGRPYVDEWLPPKSWMMKQSASTWRPKPTKTFMQVWKNLPPPYQVWPPMLNQQARRWDRTFCATPTPASEPSQTPASTQQYYPSPTAEPSPGIHQSVPSSAPPEQIPGPQGPPGPPGPPGPAGLAGSSGSSGVAGAAGVSGVSGASSMGRPSGSGKPKGLTDWIVPIQPVNLKCSTYPSVEVRRLCAEVVKHLAGMPLHQRSLSSPSNTTDTDVSNPHLRLPKPRKEQCCMFTWECVDFLKDFNGEMSNGTNFAQDLDNFNKGRCCIEQYKSTCSNPQQGPIYHVRYPPACSNPLTEEWNGKVLSIPKADGVIWFQG